MPVDPRVEIVAKAIAEDAGWTADEDIAMAYETAEIAVDALEDRGYFDG